MPFGMKSPHLQFQPPSVRLSSTSAAPHAGQINSVLLPESNFEYSLIFYFTMPATLGNWLMSVCGRNSADMYSSIKFRETDNSI